MYGWTREDFVQAVAIQPSNEGTTSLAVKSQNNPAPSLKPQQQQQREQEQCKHYRTAEVHMYVAHHPHEHRTTHRTEETMEQSAFLERDPRDMHTLSNSETSDCDD